MSSSYYDNQKEMYFIRVSRYELEEAFRSQSQFREFIMKTFGYNLDYPIGEEVEHVPDNPYNRM